MREIVKYDNNQFSKDDLLYNEAYRYSFINFDELINELSMIVSRGIIMRGKVRKLLDEGEKIVTMNFTYYLKGSQEEKNKEKEKKMDKWFEGLSDRRQSFIAYNFWDNASYEEKKEEYEAE